jgi:FlaA1/EpsC-like NDP-sugar epimerase
MSDFNRLQGLHANTPVRRIEWRSLAVFLFDLVCVVLAWSGAFLLSFNFVPPADYGATLWKTLALLLPAEALIFRMAGLYRGIWFFSSLPDLERILKSVGVSALLLFGAVMVLAPAPAIPPAILVLYPLLLIVMMGGGRALYRMWKEHSLYGAINAGGKPVLVLGAGRTGASLVQELSRSREWRVVGLLDDDPTKQQREVLGRRVLGALNELPYWAGRLNAHHAILAMPSVADELRRRISAFCLQANVTAYTVPSTEQLLLEKDRLDHVRPIDLTDLLGRSPVHIDTPETRSLISGKVVMVTGAGGSIGAELCRQIAQLDPAQMLLVDNSEFALYTLTDEISRDFSEVALVPLAADVKDAHWMNDIFRRHTPAVVFHAAAYKHVPLMEEHNAWQAVRNNVLGTYVTAMAALRTEVPRFVLVSTDKAVNPTNVMGASKRMAEMVCQALQGTGNTRFEIVRFGNVLGSTGSVVPKFQAQIRQGGPLTVTHPEITRFFMSIPEATQLVLQAAAMGEGGEIFVLDMGKPVRIADLARDMIRLSGRSEKEIPIVYTGLRPGEKLYEELLSDDEHTRPTHHPKLRIAKARAVTAGWLEEVLEWLRSPIPRSDAEVRRDLRRWVSEYQPTVPPTLKPIPISSKGSLAS